MSDSSESVIEEILENPLYQAVNDRSAVVPQYWLETSLGKFRADFVVKSEQRSIAIECDGTQFHDADRDEIRDAAILSQTEIDTVYRIPGLLILDHHLDCIAIISLIEPDLFDEDWLTRHRNAISFPANEEYREQLLKMDSQIEIESFRLKTRGLGIGVRTTCRFMDNDRHYWKKIAGCPPLRLGALLTAQPETGPRSTTNRSPRPPRLCPPSTQRANEDKVPPTYTIPCTLNTTTTQGAPPCNADSSSPPPSPSPQSHPSHP